MQKNAAVLNEDRFPGNAAAYEGLQEIIASGRALGFVGAGASVPHFPTWKKLLSNFLTEAIETGRITNEGDKMELTRLIESDILEAATSIESSFGHKIFRAKLTRIFSSSENKVTKIHHLLSKLSFSAHVTTN